MYSVIIVEDEVNILNYMKKRLSSFGEFTVMGAYCVPEEALLAFDGIQPEVAFLDIEMPRMNGIELASRLLEKKSDLKVVFTTAFGQYALEAFGVEAIDYLMKPVEDKDIERVIKRLNKAVHPLRHQLAGKSNSGYPVSCFGRFEVLDMEGKAVNWPTRKSEELFAYFVINQERHLDKWVLLEVLWPGADEERGLQNLYNTIYRVKQVLKKLPMSPQIQKINEGYKLTAGGCLSDAGMLLELVHKSRPVGTQVEEVLFSYRIPLFGTRGYIWSLPVEKSMAELHKRLFRRIMNERVPEGDFAKEEMVIRHCASQHLEDEGLLLECLKLLESQEGYHKEKEAFKSWLNEKLREEELPPI